MVETRRRYDPDFRAAAIRIVTETGKSCAEVARDLGINETTLARSRSARAVAGEVAWAPDTDIGGEILQVTAA